MTEGPLGRRVSSWIYGKLLLLFPSRFRRDYGLAMLQAFRDRWDSEQRRNGTWVGLRVWRIAMPDLLASAALERRVSRRRKGSSSFGGSLGVVTSDIRYATRSLVKHPAFVSVAIVTLGLGIGANTALFTVIHGMLIRPLPFEDADRIVYAMRRHQQLGFMATPSTGMIERWRQHATSFETFETYAQLERTLTDTGTPLVMQGVSVSVTFLSSFGIRPVAGRALDPRDTQRDTEPVALISERVWRQRFGGSANAIGTTIRLSDTTYTIVGVAPSNFDLALVPHEHDFWIAHDLEGTDSNRLPSGLHAIARLRNGVTIQQANAQLAAIGLPEQDALTNWEPAVVPPWQFVGTTFSTALWVLFGAVTFVLLIAGTNVTNMLLARGLARSHEIAVRSALGASRWRITSLLVTEAALIYVAGGVAGLLVAFGAIEAVTLVRPQNLEAIRHVPIDGTSLLFTFLITGITMVLLGGTPAWWMAKRGLRWALGSDNSRGTASRTHGSIRQALVVTEVALAVVLMTGAGLMVRSFLNIQRVDPGFDPNNLGMIRVSLPRDRYGSPAQRELTVREIADAITRLPDVEAAVLAGGIPPRFGVELSPPEIEGVANVAHEDFKPTSSVVTDVGYFAVVGTRLVRGRGFDDGDLRSDAMLGVVNTAFAERYWPGDDPLGKRFRFDTARPWVTVIGVAENVRAFGLLDDPSRGQVYILSRTHDHGVGIYAIRANRRFDDIVPALERAVWSIDPDLPVRDAFAADAMLARSVGRQTFATTLFTVFGAIATALAAIGIYGVIAVTIGQRTHEFGIRRALGARDVQISALVLRKGLFPVTIGVAAGLIAAIILTRFLGGLVVGVETRDPVTLAVVFMAMLVVATAACAGPIRRAVRLDAAEVLNRD